MYQSTDLLSEGGGGEDFFLERFAFRIVRFFPLTTFQFFY